ncbi:MAG: Ni/Fe hydrogenase subunit alpha [Planctomycetes bacterium]|jgi:NAD-reducing hydrogenase large subunit|nr:Ni/Fe hydrogenase subunit alpha [Planctomycetota bacterium]MBT4028169.1 Ni/Fe hydrogenase subunit alpha [Planctomycetota bacterium]MBT4560706.1 Ni/Fe hydrogenase subunit alpha [Planctomycetota bacterium]MBT5101924.1 Ni/Fe hydrogenase subunit alpha [Planctomycetota bacterium]MBT5119574.1 Ni/Fe hydrogenase subunit alpha [Planctomycetota bacterium]
MSIPVETSARKITIEPVTRVEGHGKVTILLDDDGKVQQARLHIVEFRGFERFIQGRPFWEVPVIVQRLCGICPVSHHLAAAKAMDIIVGVDELSPTADKMRRLMHYGQMFQSHALHFFHLCSPDLLFGFGSDPKQRNVLGVAAAHPDLAVQGVNMRRFGQEIILATAGKKIHGTGAIPGGVNKNLTIEERDKFLAEIPQMKEWALSAVAIAKNYTVENLSTVADFGTFPSNYMSLVRDDGAMDLYHGKLRAIDHNGDKLIDGAPYSGYLDHIAEEVRNWSYMKFPFMKNMGTEDGWYRVGPLARMNVVDFIDTPLAEVARQEFVALGAGAPVHVTMGYHWARMIELLHSLEEMERLLNDPDLQGDELVRTGERRSEAVGVIEAPRGTLIHHYEVDDNDMVTMANLIVSTTHNNEGMNRSVAKVANDYLSGVEITEGLLNHIEVAIRAYDPCLSCATHAMGRMPLEVELVGADGKQLDRKVKD